MPTPDPSTPSTPPTKRWKFRRNLVIYTAYRAGASIRLLADVFDLPQSRVEEIVKRWRENYGVTAKED